MTAVEIFSVVGAVATVLSFFVSLRSVKKRTELMEGRLKKLELKLEDNSNSVKGKGNRSISIKGSGNTTTQS